MKKKCSDEDIEKIKSEALIFSHQHDSLVNKILQLEKDVVLSKTDGLKKQDVKLSQEEFFNIIEDVTGIRPFAYTKKGKSEDKLIINFDNEQIRLSDYVQSIIAKKYLGKVDEIMSNENLSLSEIVNSINEVQIEIENDAQADFEDVKKVITTTEVLKGSLLLWDTQLDDNSLKSIEKKKWGKWKKRAFVAAADAIGGTIGFFAGAYVIWGITLYIPPGPSGAVGGAVIFSSVAYQYASTR